jgi:hypothetical protein
MGPAILAGCCLASPRSCTIQLRSSRRQHLARRHRTGRQDLGTDARIMYLAHSKAELAVVNVRVFFHWPTNCRNSAIMQPLRYKARGAAWDGGSIVDNKG